MFVFFCLCFLRKFWLEMNNMCKVVVSRKKGLVLVEVCYLFFWGADASMTPGVSGKAWWWGCILESSESSLPCFLLLFLKSKDHLGSWFRTSSKSSWLAWFRLLRAGVESEMSGMLVDFLTCHCWWVKQCFPFRVSASVGTYVLQHFFTSDGAVCTRVLCSWYHWPFWQLPRPHHFGSLPRGTPYFQVPPIRSKSPTASLVCPPVGCGFQPVKVGDFLQNSNVTFMWTQLHWRSLKPFSAAQLEFETQKKPWRARMQRYWASSLERNDFGPVFPS